jgi:peptidoglycan-associated lipoprotein
MSPLALKLLKRSLVIAAASLLAACASTPPATTATAAPEQKAAPAPKAASADSKPVASSTAAPTPVAGFAPGSEHRDPKSPLAKRSVFFDFDKYDIKPEYQDLIKAHAAHLGKYQNLKLLIQGNADERGSREYNLALGQKRADAVRKALGALGVAAARIESVSLGEEKPKAKGHDEASWAENRRSDILYSGEY